MIWFLSSGPSTAYINGRLTGNMGRLNDGRRAEKRRSVAGRRDGRIELRLVVAGRLALSGGFESFKRQERRRRRHGRHGAGLFRQQEARRARAVVAQAFESVHGHGARSAVLTSACKTVQKYHFTSRGPHKNNKFFVQKMSCGFFFVF